MKSIMVAGTSSSCGKSFVTTALIRYFRSNGYTVAPFKAQNISSNSVMIKDGKEIACSTYIQAYAAQVEPEVIMNPVLIKPKRERTQFYINGELHYEGPYQNYRGFIPEIKDCVSQAYFRLIKKHDIVVIEGAGSVAEINNKGEDIANEYIAQIAKPAITLVGDIHLGGVFASLHGTLDLMPPSLKEHTKTFVINKYSGDEERLRIGIEFIEKYHHVKCAGIIPYNEDYFLAGPRNDMDNVFSKIDYVVAKHCDFSSLLN